MPFSRTNSRRQGPQRPGLCARLRAWFRDLFRRD